MPRQSKSYGAPAEYEKKLAKVMERFGVKEYDHNWDRRGCYVEFRYKGSPYRFEHSVDKAKERGIQLQYGSDAFAQLVLTLEDLARMAERGIYDLQTWLEGMRFLPPPVSIPDCFKVLGFESLPAGPADVRERYRSLSKKHHPDAGGSAEAFKQLTEAAEESLRYLNGGNK